MVKPGGNIATQVGFDRIPVGARRDLAGASDRAPDRHHQRPLGRSQRRRRVTAAPDFARVTLGVTSTGRSAGEAMAANAKAANALVSLIKTEGVADIQTSERLHFADVLATPPGQATAPTITGYSVSNNVTVIVRDIPRLGALLDKAVAGRRELGLRRQLWPQRPERAPRQGAPARGRRREAQGRDLRQRGRRQPRSAHDPDRRSRSPPPVAFSRAYA